MDLSNFTDEQLAEHLNTVLNEQERRASIANMPAQICAMTAQYVANGGDRETIIDALNEATE